MSSASAMRAGRVAGRDHLARSHPRQRRVTRLAPIAGGDTLSSGLFTVGRAVGPRNLLTWRHEARYAGSGQFCQTEGFPPLDGGISIALRTATGCILVSCVSQSTISAEIVSMISKLMQRYRFVGHARSSKKQEREIG